MKNKFIALAALAIGFASCEPEFEKEVTADYSAGEADFSSYVAVGNSLTAGFMDNTVSRVGQTYSYPNLLAQQFALVGGGAFTQPSFAEDVNNLGGFAGQPGSTRLVIDATQLNADGTRGAVEPIAGASTITLTPQAKAYNNMGVPGAKSFHLGIQGYGALNPYFARHATTPTATVLGDAMSKAPTFFTNWIGSNDVLAYATSGGVGVDQNAAGNTNPTTYGFNDITNANTFNSVYSTIVNTLTSNGAKGVVCTIPSVTSIPFFTTVKYNPIPDAALSANPNIALITSLHQFLALATNGRISPLNVADGLPNAVIINDETLSDLGTQITAFANGSGNPILIANASTLGNLYGRARSATSSDLIVLRASSIIGQVNTSAPAPFNVNGVTLPLSDQFVLIPSELTAISNATAAYNNSIISIADAKNAAAGKTVVAVADMNAILAKLVSGLKIETGSIYTANYFGGSATEGQVLFSLDGVHPNARGYAVIANEIIKVINTKFKANLPLQNPTYFPGINILPTN
ncbi:G-D-S-L family lipolytic protein [Flavobacterium difficile]|uniref:G-D-S-L family lipolytic protein n=1 Tax=Flavobacterium difficile TaxID=2709659 RepID=A0ABX0I8B9_9FLAO|nr:G-D-S-L family lipolytic protein [Flavobacterium difficile]NHM02891.1 G-D-S-L family lipolytic protein [Flavobacterium difficile]